MKFLDLRYRIKTNLFVFNDVIKYFPAESASLIKTQLIRFQKRGLIGQLKKGHYYFDIGRFEPYETASWLYKPSYVSLESALFYYGMIPDIPQAVTSVSPTTTKKITTTLGSFFYAKISPRLFFGYKTVLDDKSNSFYLAKREKALLDFFYIRKIRKIDELRLNLKEIDKRLYFAYIKSYPAWVGGILIPLRYQR